MAFRTSLHVNEPDARASAITGKRAKDIADRFTASIDRPNADPICRRFAIRRMSCDRFVPAACMTAGLKNKRSPFSSGSCTWALAKNS